jgi:hypothetical protein
MPRLEDFYTVKAAATEIGIEYKALLARINRGKVAHERMGERIILIPTAEVQRLKELGNC